MRRLTKKQQQALFIEQFLQRIRQAPGERVYMAVGDLFKAAEVHDLDELRVARRAAGGRGDEKDDGSLA